MSRSLLTPLLLVAAQLFGQSTPWIPSSTKTIDLPKSTEPATNANKGRIWVAADGKLHYKDTAGADIEVGTGGTGDITTLAWTPPGTGGVATTQKEVNERHISVLDYLTATDRAKALAGTIDYDSTYAFTAAMNRAAATGIGKVYAPGRYAANIVISQSGVVIKGGGMQALQTTPVNYIAPWSTSSPVIQVGNDTGYVTGSGVEDILLYTPTGTGQKGLVFSGGAYKSYCRNVQSRGFTVSCFEFTNDDSYPCSFIRADNISAVTNVSGAIGINLVDKHVAGTGWTTAIEVNGFESTAPNGYQIQTDSASGAFLNGYLQCSYSGKGLYFKKSYTYNPSLLFQNVEIDSMSGAPTGYSYVSVIYDGGVDALTSGWSNSVPLSGSIKTNGSLLVLAGHTTGSITSGQATLTVASTTGITPGKQVHVPGGGASGAPLIATVNSISGNVLTLNTNASATVSNGDVGYGHIVGMDLPAPQVNASAIPGIVWQPTKRKYTWAGLHNTTYRASGAGAVEPSSTTGLVTDVSYNAPEFHMSPVAAAAAPSTITQSGTTITVTTSGSHYAGVGDLVVILGCNEPGVNGEYTVLARSSATAFTVTSGTSQTLAGVTGSPTVQVFKVSAWRNGRLELPASDTGGGLAFRSQAGTVASVFYQDTANAGTRLKSADTTNGFLSATWGSSVTTGTGFSFGNSSNTKASFTGNGVLKLATASAPSSDASFGQFYTNTSNSQTYTMNPGGTATLLSLDKTITAGGTTGAQTINTPVGTVNFAAGATSLVVTNSWVTTSSVVLPVIRTNDATAKIKNVVCASGSFTINMEAAVTAETSVGFRVIP